MKTGRDINTLAKEIARTAKLKKDYAISTAALLVRDSGELAFKVADQPDQVLYPTRHCINQMSARVGIPRAYAQRLATEAPELLARNLNHWFTKTPEMRMVRTLQDTKPIARAFLSHRYRVFDNQALVENVIPHLVAAGCEIKSCEITEKRLYVQAVTPKLAGEVKVGDTIQAGVTIGNSEVGSGSIKVEPLLYRLACSNGMVLPTAMRRHHVGRSGEGEWDGDSASEVFSDETRALDDKAFWAKVRDVVTDSLTLVKFNAHLKRMQESAKVKTGKPADAVEIVTRKFSLGDEEGKSVLEHLCAGGDLSLWGLANAVTRTANDLELYDRAVELERIGGEIVQMPATAFA